MSDNTPESNQDSGSLQAQKLKAFQKSTLMPWEKSMKPLVRLIGLKWVSMAKQGIIAVVVIAQIIIKVIIDTINFFPILPGLLELLGVIVVGQWSWQNLRTSENREAVLDKVQNLKKTYLG